MTATAKKHETIELSDLQEQCLAYFTDIQNRICQTFESLDTGAQFQKSPWKKGSEDQLQGHGEMRVMRGDIFEKVGVNFSHVYGVFDEKFRAEIPGAIESDGHFWAAGVSVVAHMKSPLVPTVHMNIRRIQTSKGWFGGGSDLTPTIEFAEDTEHFHAQLQEACDSYREGAYDEFKHNADQYFFIKHWNEARGVGGIFFDNLNSGDEEFDFQFLQNSAEAFLKAYADIVQRRKDMVWSPLQKEMQYEKRAKYVEFNLLYDRGTRFGFMTGGNPEAILMSMPPVVKWP